MKEELAALKKKHDAGDITDFKFRKGTRDIKKKYGKDTPSTASKVMKYITTKGPMDAVRDFAPKLLEISPQSAKAVAARKTAAAKKKAAEQTARSDRQLIKKAKAGTTPKENNFLAGLDLTKKKKRAAPKFNPSGLKVPAKKKAAAKKTAAKSKTAMYHPLNPKTGKADTSKPKVSVAVRLKQEDRYKSRKMVETAAKSSMKKKKRG